MLTALALQQAFVAASPVASPSHPLYEHGPPTEEPNSPKSTLNLSGPTTEDGEFDIYGWKIELYGCRIGALARIRPSEHEDRAGHPHHMKRAQQRDRGFLPNQPKMSSAELETRTELNKLFGVSAIQAGEAPHNDVEGIVDDFIAKATKHIEGNPELTDTERKRLGRDTRQIAINDLASDALNRPGIEPANAFVRILAKLAKRPRG
jgi:hypothetical protein